jgi:6,7-dimethyl-8-ribityllumazine synthase
MSLGSPTEVNLDASGLRFAIVASRWNEKIVEQLIAGAQTALQERGAGNVRLFRCSGAFELGPMAARVARAGDVDGIIALACLIRGGTEHYRLLADESTRALGVLAMEGATNPKALAVSFCVLACDTLSQAQERADPGQGDRGGEAALACIEQARALAAVG